MRLVVATKNSVRIFHEAASWLGIREVLTAPQSPWQNACVERLIGSIRREDDASVVVETQEKK